MIASTLLVLVGSLAILLIVKWIRERKHKLTLFKRLGVAGPEPSLLMGNFPELMTKGMKDAFVEWTKKYGKIFGYYEGEVPVLVIAEPDLIKQICIKEFSKFHSHKDMLLDEIDYPQQDLFLAEGEKWRRLRNIISPSFSSGRMKQMSPLINKSVSDLLDLFEKISNEGKPFDIYEELGRFSTDVVSSCAFGVESECLKDKNSKFLVKTKHLFDLFENNLPKRLIMAMMFSVMFPDLMNSLKKHFKWFDRFTSMCSEFNWHNEMAKQVILQRKETMEQDSRIDFIHLMLEANKQAETGRIVSSSEVKSYTEELSGTTSPQPKKVRPMTIEEMQGQVRLILNAGYETTSTALGYTAYQLALNPHVQKKLQREIDEHFPTKDAQPEYTDVQKLPYMDVVMKEVLRIHPIAIIGVTRKCYEETKYRDLTIPKGMMIQLNMNDVHFNPELWGKHDPKEFVPERFLEDCGDTANTMAWIPFGVGPRMCLGTRFAYLEYKIALTRILKKFNIKRCDETKVPCPTKKFGLLSPSEGVFVKLEKRV